MILDILNALPVDKLEIIFNQFTQWTKENPVVGGVIGMWFLGAISFLCKNLPAKIMNFFVKQFTVTLTISNTDPVFFWTIKWFDEQGYGKKSRTLKLNQGKWGCEEEKVSISPGYGNFYFWYKKRPYRFYREKNESSGIAITKETVIITTIGRNQKHIRNLIKNFQNKKKDEEIKTNLYKWKSDGWQFIKEQQTRPLDSVILNNESKTRIIDSIKNFHDRKEWYINNGIPYRMGIALYGPPGTGKTSVATALCTEFKKDLYQINLSMMGDDMLLNALSSIDNNAIILIEDIDTFDVTKKREVFKQNANNDSNDNKDTFDYNPLTLSGILNAIDGIVSSSGRILIITTNDINKLDDALLRKGRIDIHEYLGPLTHETFIQMFKRFFPDFQIPSSIKFKTDITPAIFQGYVLDYFDNPQEILNKVSNNISKLVEKK